MPNYGDAKYWDDRYKEDADGNDGGMSDPFDWLFSYHELRGILNHLLPDKDVEALLIGCGNAPFSVDMHEDGYKKIINADYSEVVISQQQRKFPDMNWVLMDALHTGKSSDSMDAIIDKSLIDTILCYQNSTEHMTAYMNEMYRILKPGARFITFSLHPIHEVIGNFEKKYFDWDIRSFNVRSCRWDETAANRNKSVSHAMIVCDKRGGSSCVNDIYDSVLYSAGALTDEEHQVLRLAAKKINEDAAISPASIDGLMILLGRALAKVELSKQQHHHEY